MLTNIILFVIFSMASSTMDRCLLFAFNTVQRPNNADYLDATVMSISNAIMARDWNTQYCSQIQLVAMSQSNSHKAFESITKNDIVVPVDNSRTRTIDKHANDQPPVDDDNNPFDRPSAKVRQQSTDLISLLDFILPLNFTFYVLTEDDAILCNGALARIIDDLSFIRSVFSSQWSIFRTSIGFIGIILHWESARALRAFLNAYYLIKPPDLLLSEFAHGAWPGSSRNWTSVPLTTTPFEQHQNVTYPKHVDDPKIRYLVARGDLFRHLGVVSSLRSRQSSSSMSCHRPLSGVADGREYYRKECLLRHFVSPCQ